jgi:hypothetical protein
MTPHQHSLDVGKTAIYPFSAVVLWRPTLATNVFVEKQYSFAGRKVYEGISDLDDQLSRQSCQAGLTLHAFLKQNGM